MRLAVALAAAALAPAAARAQAIAIGAAPEPGGIVVGRVCLDRDGDGRCGADEPGIAGARVLAEGGEVALADADGRFHLLGVPGRIVLRDRSAYGGHVVALEGLGARRAFELGPDGAAAVELAVPAPRAAPPPPLAPTPELAPPPEREAGGALSWGLAARTAPGAVVRIAGASITAGPDGAFAATVPLASGENRVPVWILGPEGGGSVWIWPVHLVPRARGGDLVLPRPPERAASLSIAPAAGGGALVAGEVAAGRRVRVGGVLAGGGPGFAGYLPPGGALEVLDAGGSPLASVEAVAPAPRSGLRGLAALGEVEISAGGGPGTLVTARGAAAARGRIGPFDYEAGVDLDDRDRQLADLVRPRDALEIEHAPDSARTFVATGDQGASDDRNPGRGRVWGKLEGEGARLEVGGTRAGLTGSELGRYDRALSGAKAVAEREIGPLRVGASAFGATLRADAGGNAPPRTAHDALDATGGAAFWLAHGEVVPGSEAIRIEWRDPFTARLAGQRVLVRGEDYEIDWVSGRLVLAAPLASVRPPAAVLTGDPFAAPQATVVADYLFASAGRASEDLQGGRVGAALGPVAVSAHGAREDRPGSDYRLVAGTAALDLGPWLVARAEAARSRGALFARGADDAFARTSDGGLAFAPLAAGAGADALHVEARGSAGPVAYGGWWRERGAGYSDSEFREAVSARERGAEIAAEQGSVSAGLRWAERRGGDPRDPAGLAILDARQLVARAGWHGERLGLVAEAVHAEHDEPASAAETSAGARAFYEIDPSLTVDVSHHQGLHVSGAGVDPTFTAVGATLAQRGTALSVRGGWGPEIGPRLLVGGERRGPGEAVYGTFTADPDAPGVLGERVSALGARRAAGAAEVFTEEQFARDAFGLRQARVFGVAVTPARGLRVSISGERGSRLALDGTEAAREAAAGAIGLVAGPIRLAARGEAWREGSGSAAAAGASAEWLPSPGVQLGARTSWTHGTGAGREALGFDATLGGALRRDRFSLLANVSRIVEQRPGEARRDGVVGRLAGTADAIPRVEIGLGTGIALQRVAGGHDDRLSGSARARVRVVGPFDTAVEYARRAPLGGGALDSLDAIRAEVGVGARECRIAVGYNLLGFGGDGLSPAADTNRLYVRAQLAY